MTEQETKPQITTGGALDIHEEDTKPIGGDAQLKGKTTPATRQPQPQDANSISENTEGDGQHKIDKDDDETTDLPQTGSP